MNDGDDEQQEKHLLNPPTSREYMLLRLDSRCGRVRCPSDVLVMMKSAPTAAVQSASQVGVHESFTPSESTVPALGVLWCAAGWLPVTRGVWTVL